MTMKNKLLLIATRSLIAMGDPEAARPLLEHTLTLPATTHFERQDHAKALRLLEELGP